MSIVLDASATIASMYNELPLDRSRSLEDAIAEDGALVPSIWRLEIANVLLSGLRLSRHTSTQVSQYFEDLSNSKIYVDHESEGQVWQTAFMLAAKHQLTSYDAAYLELASRLRLPLATLDRALTRAAQAERIPLFWN